MTVEYKIEDDYIRFTLAGSFDSGDIKAEGAKLLHDENYRPKMNVLVDNRPSEVVAETEDIRLRVEYVASVGDFVGSRIAVLVSSTAHYGLARMAGLLGDSRQLTIEVFTRERDALRWLRTGSRPS